MVETFGCYVRHQFNTLNVETSVPKLSETVSCYLGKYIYYTQISVSAF